MAQEPRRWTNADVIAEFRANRGRVGGPFAGADLVLLTTTGARSGRPHTTPLGVLRDGGQTVVFATNAGADRDPAWLHNVRANPEVTVEEPGHTYPARAVEAPAGDSRLLFDRQAERVPGFGAYREMTGRAIAAVILRRAEPAAPRAGAEARRRAGEFLVRVHADLRRDLVALRGDIAAVRDGGQPLPRELAVELGRRCLTACTALHGHHTNEDGAFDAFQRELPGLAPVLDRLRAEHRQVAAALAHIAAAPADRLDDFAALVGEIEEHFAYEERELVPALLG